MYNRRRHSKTELYMMWMKNNSNISLYIIIEVYTGISIKCSVVAIFAFYLGCVMGLWLLLGPDLAEIDLVPVLSIKF